MNKNTIIISFKTIQVTRRLVGDVNDKRMTHYLIHHRKKNHLNDQVYIHISTIDLERYYQLLKRDSAWMIDS